MKPADESIQSDYTQGVHEYNANIVKNIRSMLTHQPFSILATQGEGQPYGSLIAFACTHDLKHFFFTTPKATRKYMLLSKCSRVSMVIDTRSDHPHDMKKIEAVTVTGTAEEYGGGPEYAKGIQMLKDRHAYMAEFLEAESTALFRVDVTRYFYVTRFQEVSQWAP